MSFMELAPVLAMASSIMLSISKELLENGDFVIFLFQQIIAAGLFILGGRFTSLLGHLVQHSQDIRITQFPALIHLDLLDGGQDQPNHAQARLVTRLHGGFHLVRYALLEGCCTHGLMPNWDEKR